jgi:predicted PurR-regulated permease PerM
MNKINIRPLLILASLVIIIAGMKAIASVLNLFLVAILIAVILEPFLVLLLKRGWSKTLSLIVIIITLVITAVFLNRELRSIYARQAI